MSPKRSWSIPVFVCALALAAPGPAWAQQKQKVTYKAGAEATQYPKRHTLDVGDEDGHQLVLFEIRRTFGADAPVINGAKLKEQWTRGYGDYVNNNGLSQNYSVYVLESGDKFYAMARTMGHAESGKRSTVSVGEIRGGTGKLVGMRGLIRSKGGSEGAKGYNESQTEIEYWFVK